MPLYIEKINGDVNRPTDRPTDRVNIEQSAFFESKKIEKRQRFAIKSIGAEKVRLESQSSIRHLANGSIPILSVQKELIQQNSEENLY